MERRPLKNRKSMKKLFALMACAGLFAAGCSEDPVSDEAIRPSDAPTVRLRVDAAPDTRAQLDGHSVNWQAGDRILVNGSIYTLEGSADEGWWLSVPEADSYEAVYPADLVQEGTLRLPATQYHTAGSFDPAAHPMRAEAATAAEGLSFRNLCSLVELQLTGNGETLRSIALRSNAGELLAGPASSADTATGLVVAAGDDAATEETLVFDEEVVLSAEPLSLYLVIAPTEFAEGFTLVVTTDSGTMTQSTAVEQTAARSGILVMPSLAFEADVTPTDDYSDPRGVFVLNEGNMTSEPGSLIWISPNGEVFDDVYGEVNGSALGNSTQDLCIADGRMYIISQDGGNDGMLIVADLQTMRKEAAWSKEQLSSLSKPTHVAVLDEHNLFIRDNAGIYRFDTATSQLSFIEGSSGAKKLTMAMADGKVFAASKSGLLVLEPDTKTARTIELEGTVTGVLRSSDGNLWVSTTSPARIAKIDAATGEIIRSNEVTLGSLSAGWGATPGITAVGDLLYYSGSTTTVYRHDFATSESEKMLDVSTVVENAKVVYNNIAAHPLTGRVYMTTIKGYGTDYLTNNITVLAPDGTDGLTLEANYTGHTRFPAGIFFTANFE